MKPKSKPKTRKAKPSKRGSRNSSDSLERLVRRPALLSLKPTEGFLYEAVARYVEAGGGNVVVIGGIEVQQWPNDPKHKYRVAVSFLGRAPEYHKPPKWLLSDLPNNTMATKKTRRRFAPRAG